MRLVIATKQGLHTVRWIRGERAGSTEATALEREEVCAIVEARATIYAATRSAGVFRSSDRGDSWERLSAGIPGHQSVSLASAPGGRPVLYLGVEPAALYVSRNGGMEWEELPAFRALGDLGSERWQEYGAREAHVQSVACDPHAPTYVYAGVEIGGAYRSADGGTNWTPINEGLYDDVHRLAVDPRDGSRLYAATGDGLHISRDRGARWTRAEGDPGTSYCTDLLVPAATGRTTLFVATAGGPPSTWTGRKGDAGARLWSSRNGGESWEPADDGPRERGRLGYTALADDAAREDVIFVAGGDGSVHYVEEGGKRWRKILFGLPPITGVVVL